MRALEHWAQSTQRGALRAWRGVVAEMRTRAAAVAAIVGRNLQRKVLALWKVQQCVISFSFVYFAVS